MKNLELLKEMNKFKTVLITLIISSSFTVSAQPPQGGRNFSSREMAIRQTDNLKESLKLSKEQYKSIFEINLKISEELIKIRSNPRGNLDKVALIMQKKDSLIKSNLTPEQAVKYDEVNLKRRAGVGQQGNNPQEDAPKDAWRRR